MNDVQMVVADLREAAVLVSMYAEDPAKDLEHSGQLGHLADRLDRLADEWERGNVVALQPGQHVVEACRDCFQAAERMDTCGSCGETGWVVVRSPVQPGSEGEG